MKKLILISLTVVMMTGCASFGSNQSYLRYLDAKRAQAQAERQPILDLQLDEDGGIGYIFIPMSTLAPEIIVLFSHAGEALW